MLFYGCARTRSVCLCLSLCLAVSLSLSLVVSLFLSLVVSLRSEMGSTIYHYQTLDIICSPAFFYIFYYV